MSQEMSPVAQQFAACVDRLANLPDVYLKVLAALDHPDVSIADVADVIAADATLSSAVFRLAGLQLVNSTFYGYARSIRSIEHAVNLIGLEQVRELVLTTSVEAMSPDVRPQPVVTPGFWRDSVRRGVLARELARTVREFRRAATSPAGPTRLPARAAVG